MTNAAAIHQRCWNHESRASACRCPECGRSYCAECVTEHGSRFLCAACLTRLAHESATTSAMRRNLVPAAMLMGGFLLAWLLFFGVGQGILTLTGRG